MHIQLIGTTTESMFVRCTWEVCFKNDLFFITTSVLTQNVFSSLVKIIINCLRIRRFIRIYKLNIYIYYIQVYKS